MNAWISPSLSCLIALSVIHLSSRFVLYVTDVPLELDYPCYPIMPAVHLAETTIAVYKSNQNQVSCIF